MAEMTSSTKPRLGPRSTLAVAEADHTWSKPLDGWVVLRETLVARPNGDIYTLLPDDLITQGSDGEFWKECPGLQLLVKPTEGQLTSFKPVEFIRNGLKFKVLTL